MNKKINCHCCVGESGTEQRSQHNARFEVKQFQDILDRFYTEEGFDEFCELNTVEIMVGSAEYSASTYFCPETWETIETAIETIICHIIEANELDKYPYYERLIEKYSKKLGVSRGSFVN